MRVVLMILGGLILLVVGFVAGCLTGVSMAAGLASIGGPPEGVQITVDAPAQIKLGQTGTLTVTVKNLSDKPRTLVDIDLGEDYLRGLGVQACNPAPRSTDRSLGTFTHSFSTVIPAGGEHVVTFTLSGNSAGTWSGDVDVSVDSIFSLTTTTVTTTVGD